MKIIRLLILIILVSLTFEVCSKKAFESMLRGISETSKSSSSSRPLKKPRKKTKLTPKDSKIKPVEQGYLWTSKAITKFKQIELKRIT